MTLVRTETLSPDSFRGMRNMQVYNGLDCCLTYEVFEEIGKAHGAPPAIYNFERALQAPYLAIMRRGIAIDEIGRRKVAEELAGRIDALRTMLDEFAQAIWGKGLNPFPGAYRQIQDFFYGELGIPEIYSYKKGVKKVSTDRDAFEKFDDYLYARPFASIILRIRDLKKQLEVFETEIDPDGRWRPGYNITGTETGRSSSSENAFGTAGNTQNIPEPLRWPFVSDPGRKFIVVDLEQAEARDVGYICGALFDKWKFLENCESGDLHTKNAKLVYPELPWVGHPGQDKKIAEQLVYRDYSYRYMAKRLGHLTNYMGTAFTSARILKIPQAMAEEFRLRYVTGPDAAYPEIGLYWQWCAERLQTTYSVRTPFGRERLFFGRPGDDATLREMIAFVPQSMTADRMSLGMWRIWRESLDPASPLFGIELLGNGYDSVMLQYDESKDEGQIVRRVLALVEVPLYARGRKFIVPGEAKVGWNWGNEVKQSDVDKALRAGKKPPRLNTDGLRKWSPTVKDDRVRTPMLRRIAA